VRFGAYHEPDRAEGEGVIRAIYADHDRARVARVVVEVTVVKFGPCEVGELLDLHLQQVSTRLVSEAALTRIDDCTPQFSVRSEIALRNAGFTTLGDLAAKTPGEMLRCRNIGRKIFNEVEMVLAAHGLKMAQPGEVGRG
jgi:hypothetical protein